MQGLVKKKFVLYYSPDFAGGERIQLVEGISFFTEGKGFHLREINDVAKMEKNATLNIGPLKVWRVM